MVNTPKTNRRTPNRYTPIMEHMRNTWKKERLVRWIAMVEEDGEVILTCATMRDALNLRYALYRQAAKTPLRIFFVPPATLHLLPKKEPTVFVFRNITKEVV